jgi:hypothetical protein
MTAQHIKLIEWLVLATLSCEIGDWCGARRNLEAFAREFRDHAAVEEVKFYFYAEYEMRDCPAMVAAITEHKSAMMVTRLIIKTFIEQYVFGGPKWSDEFRGELPSRLGQIYLYLAQRIVFEEKHLFPLYAPTLTTS